MLLSILLAISWLILLLRYPHKAAPVSLCALAALAVLIGYTAWEQQRDEKRLALIDIHLRYAPEQCPAAKPLLIELYNGSQHMLHELRWKLYIHAPGQSANLIHGRSQDLQYDSPSPLRPEARWQTCQSLPALAPGYRAATLVFTATDRRGRFVR